MTEKISDFADDRLRYLYESHRLGTMRAASELLDVAPSSISRQISGLERDLGIALIEKGRHSIRLTPAGTLVLAYYRERLSQREALVAEIDDLRGLRQGHLTLAVGHGLMRLALVSTIRRFMVRYPGISLTVKSVSTRDAVSLVRDDEAHFGIVLDQPNEPRVKTRLTVPHPICLLADPGHPLADRDEVRLADLVGHRLVLPEEGYRVRHLLREAERQEGISLQTVMTASSIQMIVDAVVAGIGVTVMTAGCAEDVIAGGRLRAVPIRSEALESTRVHVVVRVGRHLPTSAVALLDDLARNARHEDAAFAETPTARPGAARADELISSPEA